MKDRNYSLTLFYSLLIFFPLFLLSVWFIADRWPWPALLPATYSDRSLQHIWSQRTKWGQWIGQSVGISMFVGFLSTAVALMFAESLSYYKAEKIRIWQAIAYLPIIIPSTIFAMGIQAPLLRWGIGYTYPALILVHLIYSLPYAVFLLLDYRLSLGRVLEDVAYTMGASKWTTFWKVTFPQMLPILFTAWMMAYIISFSQYFLTLVIGGGQLQTLATIIFPYIEGGDRSLAAGFSLIFIILNGGVFWMFQSLSQRLFRKQEVPYGSEN